MQYNMTEPCKECPYLKGSGFTMQSLIAHARGEFPCHMACDLDEEGDYKEKKNGKTPHCAGALIFLEKRDQAHQMMRICERIGLYDRTKLNMDAPVVERASDCVRAPRQLREGNAAGSSQREVKKAQGKQKADNCA